MLEGDERHGEKKKVPGNGECTWTGAVCQLEWSGWYMLKESESGEEDSRMKSRKEVPGRENS